MLIKARNGFCRAVATVYVVVGTFVQMTVSLFCAIARGDRY